MTMNQESLAAGHGSCFAWQDRHGGYLHLIFTKKLSLTVPRKQVLPLPIFSIILLHASHGLPTATARNTFLHYKDFNSIILLFSISILFLEPYAAACLVLRLSSSRVPYKKAYI